MMVVAGEEPDDELLIDDVDEGADDTVLKGPVYPEGRAIVLTVGGLKKLLARSLKFSGW